MSSSSCSTPRSCVAQPCSHAPRHGAGLLNGQDVAQKVTHALEVPLRRLLIVVIPGQHDAVEIGLLLHRRIVRPGRSADVVVLAVDVPDLESPEVAAFQAHDRGYRDGGFDGIVVVQIPLEQPLPEAVLDAFEGGVLGHDVLAGLQLLPGRSTGPDHNWGPVGEAQAVYVGPAAGLCPVLIAVGNFGDLPGEIAHGVSTPGVFCGQGSLSFGTDPIPVFRGWPPAGGRRSPGRNGWTTPTPRSLHGRTRTQAADSPGSHPRRTPGRCRGCAPSSSG